MVTKTQMKNHLFIALLLAANVLAQVPVNIQNVPNQNPPEPPAQNQELDDKEEHPVHIKTEGFLQGLNGDTKTANSAQIDSNKANVNNNKESKISSNQTNNNNNTVLNKETAAVQEVILNTNSARVADTGALKRGSLVVLGLCVIVLGWYSWRTYRLRKGNPSPAVVQKYGVRANRSDMEMRPLELDEDDDDDTLFDVGNNRR